VDAVSRGLPLGYRRTGPKPVMRLQRITMKSERSFFGYQPILVFVLPPGSLRRNFRLSEKWPERVDHADYERRLMVFTQANVKDSPVGKGLPHQARVLIGMMGRRS
jgi:hypothetical protein